MTKTKIWLFIVTLAIGFIAGVFLDQFVPLGHVIKIDIFSARSKKASQGGIPIEQLGQLDLFILAGQSNMSGRGEKIVFETNPNVYVFGNDYRWRIAAEPIDNSEDQVDLVSEDVYVGYSPALSFANELLKFQPDRFIGLIPCARASSSIYAWRRSLSDETLYGSCLKRGLAASHLGKIRGILFFQGETDALDLNKFPNDNLSPDTWGIKFEEIVHSWRRDFNIIDLPVVFAEIGIHDNPEIYSNWEVVQAQQNNIDLPNVNIIRTKDLSLRDEVHFTTDSYRIIGKRFARAYLKVIN